MPYALGWARWKELEERYFLGLVRAALDGLAEEGWIEIPQRDLTARMLMAALAEAGLAVAASPSPAAERELAGRLVMRMLAGLRPTTAPAAEPGPRQPK